MIRILGLFEDFFKEMAMASAKDDAVLVDVDIVVFGGEREVPHATILQRKRHRVKLGRFAITAKGKPASEKDIVEVKEPIDASLKKRICIWAGQKNRNFSGTNWEVTRGLWNSLNPNNPIRNI